MQEINLKTSDEEKNIGKILNDNKKKAKSGVSNEKPPSKHDFSFFNGLHNTFSVKWDFNVTWDFLIKSLFIN